MTIELVTSAEVELTIGRDAIRPDSLAVNLLNSRRVLGHVIPYSAQWDRICDVRARLLDLQAAIYALDTYGEQNWSVDPDAIGDRWARISQCLTRFGVEGADAARVSGDVLQYQEVELDTRRRDTLPGIELRDFYWLKTCDVRMQRELAARAVLESDLYPGRSAWALFDVIGEVHDDLADIAEDYQSWNGNRYIALARRVGVERATGEYWSFLRAARREAARRVRLGSARGIKAVWSEKLGELFSAELLATRRALSSASLLVRAQTEAVA